ncbi:MAG: 16S rRNA (cytosine(1402)-N(4))-methyltransferase RsmH [Candidatus Roizmanbacteria bacterium]
MHTPVLLEQVIAHLNIKPGMKIIDATFGEGGHTHAFLGLGASVLAIDADQDQINRYKNSSSNELKNEKLQLVQGNYADIAEIAIKHSFDKVDVVIFDLGLSMNQMYHGEGFSYQFPLQPLNLVIDSQSKQKGAARAAEVVTEYDEERLTNIFMRYGELKRASDIARAIVRYRSTHELNTVGDLLTGLEGTLFGNEQAALFQALRIEVNHEYEQIEKGLNGAVEVLSRGGKLAVITFHSGEDRIVKLWARGKGLKEEKRVIGKKVSDKSFERSSILRIYVQS